MIRHLIIVLFLGSVACKSGRPAVSTPATAIEEAAKPEWIRSRPISSAYYIGIGRASKELPEPYESAKKNALNELASEISVNVEGNSLLHSFERKGQFDETFTSTIKTSTSELIEGFELVDSWENANEYWAYYRLSRSEHARLKAERKQKAIATAADLHSRSRASLAGGDLRTAFDQALRGLLAMKAYWGENDLVDMDGRQVPLANELYNSLQKLTSGITFSILPERCKLSYSDGFKREMLITATHSGDNGRTDLVQLPVSIMYPGVSGKVIELKNTDADGHIRTTVQRVEMSGGTAELVVKLDEEALIGKELEQALVRPLVASLTIPEARVPIDLEMPRIFMRSNETNLGTTVNDAGVAMAIREELTKKGFRFVDRQNDADMLLELNGSTRKGGEANGFFTTFLDVSFSFRDRRTQDVVHEGGRQGVKGVQLDHERAGMEAYKKAVHEIRKDLVSSMMSSIL